MGRRFVISLNYMGELLNIHPDSLLFARYAHALLLSKKVTEAIEIAKKGVAQYPSYTSGRFILGLCYIEQNDISSAMTQFTELLKIDPTHQQAISILAHLLSDCGDTENSQALADYLFRVNPKTHLLGKLQRKNTGKDTIFEILGAGLNWTEYASESFSKEDRQNPENTKTEGTENSAQMSLEFSLEQEISEAMAEENKIPKKNKTDNITAENSLENSLEKEISKSIEQEIPEEPSQKTTEIKDEKPIEKVKQEEVKPEEIKQEDEKQEQVKPEEETEFSVKTEPQVKPTEEKKEKEEEEEISQKTTEIKVEKSTEDVEQEEIKQEEIKQEDVKQEDVEQEDVKQEEETESPIKTEPPIKKPTEEVKRKKIQEEKLIPSLSKDKEIITDTDSAKKESDLLPDHILTPTFAQIYLEQGLPHLAKQIYERLISKNGENDEYLEKIKEIDSIIEKMENSEDIQKLEQKKTKENVKKPLKGKRIKNDIRKTLKEKHSSRDSGEKK